MKTPLTAMKTRAGLAFAVLTGRPVAYRVDVLGELAFKKERGVPAVVDCTIASPDYRLTYP